MTAHPLDRADALDREAARLDAEGRRLAAHIIRCRADERRRTVAETHERQAAAQEAL